MSLATGARLGAYEIVAVLGAGGMGEVYRARDTRLGREVAIKLILEMFAADPDRVARFQREAKVLASLNHPHIAALYGMEEAAGQHFLVMELVEGQTLADRLQRGPFAMAEALSIAVQIADALEAAHEKGVVHRDLKPANVKVTPDDKVKVLDFGLAKAVETEATSGNAANSPTLSMMASQAGIILGTAAYMSPEQAKGLPADHRSDVFSFGSVLFEMLSGRQPFHGDTAPEVLASVLVREPDLSRLPSDLDPRLADLVRRCLEKHPKRRWQAIGDVRAELETIAASPRSGPIAAAAAGPTRSLWRRAMPAVAGMIVVGALAAATAWRLKPLPAPDIARFSFALPAGQRFTTGSRRVLAISPDGTMIACATDGGISVRSLSDFRPSLVQGIEKSEVINSPTFSPDGKSLAFHSVTGQTLKRIAVNGGSPVSLFSTVNHMGLTWGSDGILVAEASAERRVIFRVPVTGGTPQVLITLKPNELPEGPQMLPDGDTVLFTLGVNALVGAERWDRAQIVAQSLKTGKRKILVDGGSDGRYVPTGHLTYAVGGIVYAVPFNLRTLTVTGAAVPIIEGVRRAVAGVSGFADFSFSDNGTLVYVPGPATTGAGAAFALIDREGTLTALKIPPGIYTTPRASPDGGRIALQSSDGKNSFIGVYQMSGAAGLRRITFEGDNAAPVWSSDGKRIAFQSSRDGDLAIFAQAADGTGAPERLTKPGAGESHVPESWSPTGDVLLFDVVTSKGVTLWQLSLKDGKTAPFGGVRSIEETGAVFSPDGRWVAYAVSADRTTDMFVQPFPATGAKTTLVRGRADSPHHPIWASDGSALFYVPGPGAFERVGVVTRPTFSFGNPEPVARPFQASPPSARRLYDMLPDGRILGLITPGQTTGTVQVDEIDVVLNWFEELKSRVPR